MHLERLFCLGLVLGSLTVAVRADPEVTEEVARLERFSYARSPVDNRVLTPGELVLEREYLQTAPPSEPSPQLKELITLLRLRKLLKSVIPIVPI